MTIRTTTLPSGEAVPVFGLGTWKMGETQSRFADALASSFEVSLEEPTRAGKPWILDVSAS